MKYALFICSILLFSLGYVGGNYNKVSAKSIKSSSELPYSIESWNGFKMEGHEIDGQPAVRVVDDRGKRAIGIATNAWELALGRPLGRSIGYFYGDAQRSCQDRNSLACAYDEDGIIYITRYMQEEDMACVLIHEIGHILGVPHIEGDETMNPATQRKVMRPSKFAVALAKEANGWK